MTFFKSCRCCDPGDPPTGDCRPCLNCTPSCLQVTLAGFSHGTENCNECSFLDDTKFIVRRPTGIGSCPSVSLSILDPTGTGAQLTPTYGLNANGSCKIAGISVTVPCLSYSSDPPFACTKTGNPLTGSGYSSPTLTTTTTGVECRKPVASFSTDDDGKITGVTVADGGEYWPDGSCEYVSDKVCAVCPPTSFSLNNKREMYATLSVGSGSNTVRVIRREWYDFGGGPRFTDTVQVTGTQSTVADDGSFIGCDGFTIESKNVTGCTTNGSITIASTDCSTESVGYCENKGDLPDQITLTLSGMGNLFVWSSRGGGSPGTAPCPDPDDPNNVLPHQPFCGECGATHDILIRQGGSALGWGYQGQLVQQDFSAVLDRSPSDCEYLWTGFAPVSPSEGANNSPAQVYCNGELEIGVSVGISPTGLSTGLAISGPTKAEGEPATAEVTSIGQDGDITGVTLTANGSGYAAEIVNREEPSMSVSTSGSGTGATFSVTLEEYGNPGEESWSVSKVAVTNGGTGYVGTESVLFAPESGATTESEASAELIVGRTQPTLSASVNSANGSGATLSLSLNQTVDFNGFDVWEVASVSVTNGGSSYLDGEPVTFTATDGVEVFGASATITTGRTAPDVTASVPALASSGTGATLGVTLTKAGDIWEVTAVTVADGGAGYAEYDPVEFATDDTSVSQASAYVSAVDQDGAITAVFVLSGGAYYRSTGVVNAVSLDWGGSYYKSTGSVQSVLVYWGGSYYKLVGTGQVTADTPTVAFSSAIGTGATATATVDTSLSSPTFGQITAITITNGGQDYRLGGTGWMLGITIGGFSHLESLIGTEEEPEPDPDPQHCSNFWGQYQPIANRVSTEPCPTDLLSKSYTMAVGAFSLPFGDPYGDGLDNATWCRTPAPSWGGAPSATFFDFGNGAITCQISPA